MPMTLEDLERELGQGAGVRTILPDLAYLAELDGLVLTNREGEPPTPTGVRLSAACIDFHEQVALKKDQFA
jgi:hypothetical protein